MIRVIALAVLYVLAAPVYAVIGIRKVMRLWRIRATLHRGTIVCPHCGVENNLDILATCTRCRTTEYGNRLRCSACGDLRRGFDCDNPDCGVTIRVL